MPSNKKSYGKINLTVGGYFVTLGLSIFSILVILYSYGIKFKTNSYMLIFLAVLLSSYFMYELDEKLKEVELFKNFFEKNKVKHKSYYSWDPEFGRSFPAGIYVYNEGRPLLNILLIILFSIATIWGLLMFWFEIAKLLNLGLTIPKWIGLN